jgi:hypothetical protein
LFLDTPLAMTVRARILDGLASAVTLRAGLLYREETLLHTDLAMTATGTADFRRTALFCTGATASIAMHHSRHTNLDRCALHGVFKTQGKVVTQVSATIGTLATCGPPSATKDIAKDVTEDITETGAAGAARPTTGTHRRVHTGMAELVIGGTLLGIGKDFVRLFGLLEFSLGFLVIRITIRVVLHSQAAIGLFQIGIAGILLYTQYFVIVALCHSLATLPVIVQTILARHDKSRNPK